MTKTPESVYESALERITRHEYELEGTSATWKDIAQSLKRIALHALETGKSLKTSEGVNTHDQNP